jgi:hypothetical protein
MTTGNVSASEQSPIEANDWIPEGYVRALDPEDRPHILPEFMVPVMHQAYAAYRHKHVLNASGAPGSVSDISSYHRFLPVS